MANRHRPHAPTTTQTVGARHRGEAIARIERQVRRHGWPRIEAFSIALCTALCGLAISAVLWRVGVESMTWRYPLAVALVYPLFISLLWLWCRRSDILNHIDPPDLLRGFSEPRLGGTFHGDGGQFGGGGASDSWAAGGDSGALSAASDATGAAFEAAGSAEEFAPVALVFALVFALFIFVFSMLGGVVQFVWGAPSLLASLMLDAGMASALYVYAREAYRNNWLGTATGRTGAVFIGMAVLLACAGYLFELYAPDAITLGDVLTAYREPTQAGAR
jgi:hypothetical protein